MQSFRAGCRLHARLDLLKFGDTLGNALQMLRLNLFKALFSPLLALRAIVRALTAWRCRLVALSKGKARCGERRRDEDSFHRILLLSLG